MRPNNPIRKVKKSSLDSIQSVIQGPEIVQMRVKKNFQLIPVQKRIKNITYKILRDSFVYEGDVRDLRKWEEIRENIINSNGRLYDVIMMDPPWRLKQNLPYPTLSDQEILEMPIEKLQIRGILILWIVNQKREVANEFLRIHGYTEVDRGEWIKLTKNGILHHGLGKYTSHSNESFIIATKGNVQDMVHGCNAQSVIFGEVKKHSQKPDSIYDFVQQMAPDTLKLEVFARTNNVTLGWDAFGNQVVEVEPAE
ncbi:MT-A70 family protein [Oxytricha trifallax]|uniref:mRNA m(6)A methyltransferase n=1 Tax=Oxytricha trifallax TaxID=1172189 RepID=A0A073I0D2_9SPIT|nr:MT-A70 family protein [Oxytricha trifallax]